MARAIWETILIQISSGRFAFPVDVYWFEKEVINEAAANSLCFVNVWSEEADQVDL